MTNFSILSFPPFSQPYPCIPAHFVRTKFPYHIFVLSYRCKLQSTNCSTSTSSLHHSLQPASLLIWKKPNYSFIWNISQCSQRTRFLHDLYWFVVEAYFHKSCLRKFLNNRPYSSSMDSSLKTVKFSSRNAIYPIIGISMRLPYPDVQAMFDTIFSMFLWGDSLSRTFLCSSETFPPCPFFFPCSYLLFLVWLLRRVPGSLPLFKLWSMNFYIPWPPQSYCWSISVFCQLKFKMNVMIHNFPERIR